MAGYKHASHIKSTDIVSVAYLIITGLYILAFEGITSHLIVPMTWRLACILGILSVIYLDHFFKHKVLTFLHVFFPILLLSFAYGETASINHFIFTDNLDPVIYNWEHALFGFQPSMAFSVYFPQRWFSEALHMGYFSYYLMTIGISLSFFILRPEMAERVIFLVVTSFFIYYLIFILFPVVGPQYYFSGSDAKVPDTGIFSRLVKLIQYYGEHPTGAFPSSHVGMVVIFLYLSFSQIRWLFWTMVPLFVCILMATVYIKAHYAIDVLAGLLSAPLVYYLSTLIYKQLSRRLASIRESGIA